MGKNADMAEDMQQDAIDCATQALEKYNIEKDIAAFIKKEFDKKYNPTWHAVVGRNFGSCHARDQALHLLLPWSSRDPPLQVGLIGSWSLTPRTSPRQEPCKVRLVTCARVVAFEFGWRVIRPFLSELVLRMLRPNLVSIFL